MRKGKLSQNEKYIIQGMRNDEKSVEDISSAIDRTEKCVSNYIDGELKDITDHVAQARIEQVVNENNQTHAKDPNKYQSHIIQETASGKKGVAVMTQTASERSDDARIYNSGQRQNRRKDCIYNIKEDKMAE